MTEDITRHVVVVDLETTGLDRARHLAVEVAWRRLDTDERGCFIPPHDWREVMRNADVAALRINRYLDRIVDQPQDEHGEELGRLYDALHGAVFAGSNPTFDTGFLSDLFAARYAGYWARPWHYRLGDLAAYAAGALGLPITQLPGLREVCDLLGVEYGELHTAAGDVEATAQCLIALDMRRVSAPPAPDLVMWQAPMVTAPEAATTVSAGTPWNWPSP